MPKSSYHRHRKRSTRGAPADHAAAVEEIRGDNVSGSQAITRRAAALVEDWLARAGIATTLSTDSLAFSLLRQGRLSDGAGSSPRTRRNGDPLPPDRRRAPGLNTRPAYANYSK